ncbi:hypothetical protein EYF80_060867 [Liparis tanakae]|uniref:Uncharacterized protein n=1 Tax=Liparis tanakae TaxID=230148 RepID=A0A4Z2EJQ1_9TELE|nr:hypothetical protein EYF80_060867 [Liparis tanakae]
MSAAWEERISPSPKCEMCGRSPVFSLKDRGTDREEGTGDRERCEDRGTDIEEGTGDREGCEDRGTDIEEGTGDREGCEDRGMDIEDLHPGIESTREALSGISPLLTPLPEQLGLLGRRRPNGRPDGRLAAPGMPRANEHQSELSSFASRSRDFLRLTLCRHLALWTLGSGAPTEGKR